MSTVGKVPVLLSGLWGGSMDGSSVGQLPGKLALRQAGGAVEVGIQPLPQCLLPHSHTDPVWGGRISLPLQPATQNTQIPHFLRLLPLLLFCSHQPLTT